MASDHRVALVLAGGGARGAYEAGAIRALAELGFEPDIIAGTSIGALNGAIVAQNATLIDAAIELERAWDVLGRADLVRMDLSALARDTLHLAALGTARAAVAAATTLARGVDSRERALLDVSVIESLFQRFVDVARVQAGRELWVAVTPMLTQLDFQFRHLLETARAWCTDDVAYLAAHSVPPEDLPELLLASAAVPFVFPSRRIGDTNYLDGGIVDNVPLAALRDRGVTFAIVVHLTHGDLFDRRTQGDPQMSVLEIRPQAPLYELTWRDQLHSLLDFSPATIASHMAAGYDDTARLLDTVLPVLGANRAAHDALGDLQASSQRLEASTRRLADDPPLE